MLIVFFKHVSVSDATGSGYTAHAQIHVRLNKSGAHIAVVRFLNHVVNSYVTVPPVICCLLISINWNYHAMCVYV